MHRSIIINGHSSSRRWETIAIGARSCSTTINKHSIGDLLLLKPMSVTVAVAKEAIAATAARRRVMCSPTRAGTMRWTPRKTTANLNNNNNRECNNSWILFVFATFFCTNLISLSPPLLVPTYDSHWWSFNCKKTPFAKLVHLVLVIFVTYYIVLLIQFLFCSKIKSNSN